MTTLLESRLEPIVSARPEMLRMRAADSEGPSYRGKYLKLKALPFAVGRSIAQGDEAMVFDLIDLRAGISADHVIKICRYAPGTPKYKSWAVPVRLEANPDSALPDVELYPARLSSVPGGFIKLQPFLCRDPSEAWQTTLPALPIYEVARRSAPEDAIRKADELIDRHGDRGILHEAKGRLFLAMKDFARAGEELKLAYALHTEEGNAAVLSVALLLSAVWRHSYEESDNPGALKMELVLPDGLAFNQMVFERPEDAAADDTLQERSMYLLLEVLAKEPFFIAGLAALADELLDLPGGTPLATRVVECAERLDPEWQRVADLRRTIDRRRAAEDGSAATRKPDRRDGELPPAVPDTVREHLEAYNRLFRPEPSVGQAKGRYDAAIAHWQQGDLSRAEEVCRHAIKSSPAECRYRELLAHILLAQDRRDEAFSVLKQAVADLANAGAYLALAEFHQLEGEFESGLQEYLRALHSGPEDPVRVWSGLGICLDQLGEHEEAIRYLRLAIETNPGSPGSAIHLAQALRRPFFHGDRSQQAVSEMQEAFELICDAAERFPDSAGVWFCKAQALAFLEPPQRVYEALQRARQLAPDDQTIARFAKAVEESLGAVPDAKRSE